MKRAFNTQMVPLLSVFAAFSFIIMMFNLPLPGGTTGHAVGVGIATIVLGPWASILGISIALIIQAVFFGDGGITAIGANCFNMAIIGSLAAYPVYRILSGRASITSPRRIIAAGVAGYVAINLAALAAAMGRPTGDPEVAAAAAAADGSVSRALAFLDEDALDLRQRALAALERLPALDGNALHAIGDALAGTDPQPLAAFLDTVNAWLARRLDRNDAEIGRLARLAEAFERINQAASDAAEYNLERKPLVFGVFGLLAEATRG